MDDIEYAMHFNPGNFIFRIFYGSVTERRIELFVWCIYFSKFMLLTIKIKLTNEVAMYDSTKFCLLYLLKKIMRIREIRFSQSLNYKNVAEPKFNDKEIFPSYTLYQGLVHSVSRFPSGHIKRAGK